MSEVDELKSKVLKSNTETLYIGTIPKNVKEFIVDFAEKNCCGNYGFAITMLLGPLTDSFGSMQSQIDELCFRVKTLEEGKKEEKKPAHGRSRFQKENDNGNKQEGMGSVNTASG